MWSTAADILVGLFVHSQKSNRSSISKGVHVALGIQPVADVERLHLADDGIVAGGVDRDGVVVAHVRTRVQVGRAEYSSAGLGQFLVELWQRLEWNSIADQ